LGEFLDFLDRQVGKGKWTFILTADHGVAPIPEYAATINLPGKRNALDPIETQEELEKALVEKFGKCPEESYVEKMEASQVYLRRVPDTKDPEKFDAMQVLVRDYLANHKAVAAAFTRNELMKSPPDGFDLISQIRRSFNPARSGDVLFVQKEYHISGGSRATHGSPWPYDTHVPLLLLGAGIVPGQHSRPVSPAMIAPTVAELVSIKPPSTCIETPLSEAIKGK
jgi:hypothetical protein